MLTPEDEAFLRTGNCPNCGLSFDAANLIGICDHEADLYREWLQFLWDLIP